MLYFLYNHQRRVGKVSLRLHIYVSIDCKKDTFDYYLTVTVYQKVRIFDTSGNQRNDNFPLHMELEGGIVTCFLPYTHIRTCTSNQGMPVYVVF